MPVNSSTSCTVNVRNTAYDITVWLECRRVLFRSPAASGSFSGSTCAALSSGSCSFDYTPALGSEGTISLTGSYNGDTNHATSSGHRYKAQTTQPNSTSESGLPLTLPINSSTSCTVTVSDTDAGSCPIPRRPVTPPFPYTTLFRSSGSTCAALSSGSCSFDYTPALGSEGTISLTGSYNGDTNHATSSGHKDITATTPQT